MSYRFCWSVHILIVHRSCLGVLATLLHVESLVMSRLEQEIEPPELRRFVDLTQQALL